MPYGRRSYRKRRYGRSKYMAMKVYRSPMTSTRRMTYDCDKFIHPSYSITQVPTISNWFRANSVYDPDVAINLASAVGYASARDTFDHYVVMAARCTTVWYPYSTDNTMYTRNQAEGPSIPVWLGLGLRHDGSALLETWDNLMGSREWNWDSCVMTPCENNYPISAKKYRQTLWYDAKQFFNTTAPEADTTLGADMQTNPIDQAYFVLASAVQRTGAYAVQPTQWGTWAVHVHIDFYVRLQEPKPGDVAP